MKSVTIVILTKHQLIRFLALWWQPFLPKVRLNEFNAKLVYKHQLNLIFFYIKNLTDSLLVVNLTNVPLMNRIPGYIQGKS